MPNPLVLLISATCASAVLVLAAAAVPAGEPVRRALDAAAERLAPAQTGGAEIDASVHEFARMLALSVERREGRDGILPFGEAFSGAASQGGNAGNGGRGESATEGMGTSGFGWAIASLAALLLMSCRRH